MTDCSMPGKKRRLPALLVLLACVAATTAAQAKETLTWLLRDLPPLTIFEGPQKGNGAVDHLLPLLIAGMPEYQHNIQRVNRARGMQMLKEHNFTCDPTLLWTAERSKFLVFSVPSIGLLSNGLIVRQRDLAILEPFLHDRKIDLAALLAAQSIKVGLVAERSYGEQLDGLLKTAPAHTLVPHYGNDAVGSLLQMQEAGRLKVVLGYWSEARYQIQRQAMVENEFAFFPIQGVNTYQFIHVGCSDTALGRAAILRINQELAALRRETLAGYYAQWLDPQLRSQYLQDAQSFFFEQGQRLP
ncbi:TIGR02285 family protein [Pseudomonas akapageensis]|uniref:TIGR02285 family protein n=1 Tax=Pseudomonas akapageensis TaxID=2609961 RepID=UPI00140E8BBD|nr:TIGR02285 family protein [Pseudomonas akapageensis]